MLLLSEFLESGGDAVSLSNFIYLVPRRLDSKMLFSFFQTSSKLSLASRGGEETSSQCKVPVSEYIHLDLN